MGLADGQAWERDYQAAPAPNTDEKMSVDQKESMSYKEVVINRRKNAMSIEDSSRFEVGDWVESLVDWEPIKKGSVYKVIDTVYDGLWVEVEGEGGYYLLETEIKPVNILQVGKTYTSHNGSEWRAIYEEGDVVWMKDILGGPAHTWSKRGTSITLLSEGYDIDWEPIVKEGVSVYLNMKIPDLGWVSKNATINLIGGKPDWTTLEVVE